MKNLFILMLLAFFNNSSLICQLCDNKWRPAYIHVNSLDCEHSQFEICLHFTRTAEFYTLISFQTDEFEITNSPNFQELSSSSTTTYESIDDLECAEDGHCFYCFTGSVITGNQDITLNITYYDPTQQEICFTDVVVIRKLVTVSGTQNLSTLTTGTNHPLLDPTTAITTSQNIYISGTLYIDQDYTLGRDAYERGTTNIMMGNNAKIVVNADKQLTLRGTQIKGCGGEWDRIELMDGSKIYAESRGTLIRDGQYAIYAKENNDVHMHFTDFINNKWGIYAASETPRSIEIDVFGARFDGGTKASTAIGMEVYDLKATFISNLTSIAGPQPGQFKNLKYGIIAYNSNLTLMWPTMESISEVCVLSRPHSRISNNSYLNIHNHGFENFKNSKTAISVVNTDLFVDQVWASNVVFGINITNDDGYTANVTNSIISARNGGITVNGRIGAIGNIASNVITVNQDGVINSGQSVFFNSFPGVVSGEFKVEGNQIKNYENGSAIYALNYQNLNIYHNSYIRAYYSNTAGIRINGGKNNKVSCNTYINGNYSGIIATSSPNSILNCNSEISGNKGLIINGTCEQSELRNNNYAATNYDLQYGYSSNSATAP